MKPLKFKTMYQDQFSHEIDPMSGAAVSPMAPLVPASREADVFSGQGSREPTQTGLSLGFQYASELNDAEYRDESISIFSGQQFDSKSMRGTDDNQLSKASASQLTIPSTEFGRRVSQSEFLDTMLTEDALPGVVPTFSSWSLLCLGPASSYNPQKGIEQLGFFSGSNYLLPWEVRLSDNAMAIMQKEIVHGMKDSSEEQWPAPGEVSKTTGSAVSGPGAHLPIFQTISKLRSLSKELENRELFENVGKPTPTKQQKGGKTEKAKPPSISAYIGNEYECPRGHR